jgi:hypothetical protein
MPAGCCNALVEKRKQCRGSSKKRTAADQGGQAVKAMPDELSCVPSVDRVLDEMTSSQALPPSNGAPTKDTE